MLEVESNKCLHKPSFLTPYISCSPCCEQYAPFRSNDQNRDATYCCDFFEKMSYGWHRVLHACHRSILPLMFSDVVALLKPKEMELGSPLS